MASSLHAPWHGPEHLCQWCEDAEGVVQHIHGWRVQLCDECLEKVEPCARCGNLTTLNDLGPVTDRDMLEWCPACREALEEGEDE